VDRRSQRRSHGALSRELSRRVVGATGDRRPQGAGDRTMITNDVERPRARDNKQAVMYAILAAETESDGFVACAPCAAPARVTPTSFCGSLRSRRGLHPSLTLLRQPSSFQPGASSSSLEARWAGLRGRRCPNGPRDAPPLPALARRQQSTPMLGQRPVNGWPTGEQRWKTCGSRTPRRSTAGRERRSGTGQRDQNLGGAEIMVLARSRLMASASAVRRCCRAA
jgi:hypothetical protein